MHRDEAVLGVSDLDTYPWVSEPPAPGAEERLAALARTRLAPWAPANELKPARTLAWLAGAGIEASEAARMRAWRRWREARETGAEVDSSTRAWARYIGLAATLHCDATLVYGEDVLAGLPIPACDAVVAGLAIDRPSLAARQACEGTANPAFPLPDEPDARLRKLARWAALLGACVLMTRGQCRSLRGAAVLPALADAAPRWSGFLRATARCHVRGEPGAPDLAPYLASRAVFAAWCHHQVRAAAPW